VDTSVDTSLFTYRRINALGFLACSSALAFAILYLEGELGLDPCPLCTLVRIIVLTMAAIFLIAFLHNPKQGGQRFYGGLNFLLVGGGLATTARHIWLQNLPADEVPACGPGLEYMMEMMPVFDVLHQILSGSGECADIQWTYLGLTLPEQSMAFFVVMLVLVWKQLSKKNPRSYFN